MADFDPARTPGQFAAPPPHAPREVSQPLTAEAIAQAQEFARQNERVLPPFNPDPALQIPIEALTPAVDVPAATTANTPPPSKLHLQPRAEPPTHQPAASESDSPSRGVPKPIADPGKVITGGWGQPSSAQYYPLTGAEAREVAQMLMDELNARLVNDLRFTPAVTYPKARITLELKIEAYAMADPILVPYVKELTKTPVELARQHADEVVFVLVQKREEFTPEGVAVDPPDRLREELGIEVPRKQIVEMAGQRMFADRSPLLDPSKTF